MDRETEERFQRIEAALEAASKGLVVTQSMLQTVVGSQQRLQDLFGETQESIGAYVKAADTRMKQMEANLDALIRLITAEHGNGHNKL